MTVLLLAGVTGVSADYSPSRNHPATPLHCNGVVQTQALRAPEPPTHRPTIEIIVLIIRQHYYSPPHAGLAQASGGRAFGYPKQ